MNRTTTLVTLTFIILSQIFAQAVKYEDIQSIASNIYFLENNMEGTVEAYIPLGLEKDTTVYIAKYKSGGFSIISAHYAAPPLLGYCRSGEYNPKEMPGGLLYLIEEYQKSISTLFADKIKPSEEIVRKWNDLKQLRDNKNSKSVKSYPLVPPLINTVWQQGDYSNTSYNRFCPTHCKAGCCAVAMAQVLNHWKWDIDQTGSNTHGGQTVNFGNYQSYCWDNMWPTGPNDFNSTLIYHAGVSCNTDYCENGYASRATMDNVLFGFENYWGMSYAAELKRRYWIMIPSWKSRLKSDLDQNRPVVYAGGEHAWVIDGYDSDDKFHCNWGAFDGFYDDYYSLGNFNPYGQNYNSKEEAIFKLSPASGIPGIVIGPETLTGQSTTYSLDNIADCEYATWSNTQNIQAVYGSNHWISVKAISGGIGWLDASYVIDGVTYYAP